jgi:hypothetical protein
LAVVGTAVFEVPSFAQGFAGLALPIPASGALALRTPASAEVSVEVAADSILKPVTFLERP